MPDDPLRARVGRAIGHAVTDQTWRLAMAEGYVRDAEFDPASFEALVRLVRGVERAAVEIARRPPPPAAMRSRRIRSRPVEGNAQQEALAVLTAEYAANGDPLVERFRKQVPGTPLSSEQARALLHSMLAAHFPAILIERWRIPLHDHSATLMPLDADPRQYSVEVSWPRGRRSIPWHEPSPSRWHRLEYASDERREPLAVGADDQSLLGSLRATAEEIAPKYLWQPAEAARFLLEGTTPSIVPGSVSVEQVVSGGPSRTTITIRVEAFVAAEDIAAAYRSVQRVVLPRGHRGPGEKHARAAAFVAELRRSGR